MLLYRSHFFKKLLFLLSITTYVVADNGSQDRLWLNVFVHGTVSFCLFDYLEKVYPAISYGPKGLHHVSEINTSSLVHQDVEIMHSQSKHQFNKDHFYFFRWSGKLSFHGREKAGFDLYNQLSLVLREYKELYGYYPNVRIITHSHGGNVALNAVQHLPFFDDEHVYLELVLLACPVQTTTEYLIEHTEIDKSYVIASYSDWVQILDVYYHNGSMSFPRRFFITRAANCIQICVTINNRSLSHVDFLRSFFYHVPYTLKWADDFVAGESFEYAQHAIDGLPINILNCCIQDQKFCFYNGLNLVSAVYGFRYT